MPSINNRRERGRPGQPVRLAPVYDMVTTVAYIPRDVPALSLAGTKQMGAV
jgi:serine/threonine-protein kinase HipA